MINPWLRIPASEYEAHMALPEVAQAQALSKLMASALIEYTPMSLAVIGCTTGNGFEHINTALTRRVVGIDINSNYLKILETRFDGRIPSLELIKADITDPDFCGHRGRTSDLRFTNSDLFGRPLTCLEKPA